MTRPVLQDAWGRTIDYLRLSVTDRCDLRCVYCVGARRTFLPREEILRLEELDRLATAFVHLGVRRLRLTGGEPLVRAGVLELVHALGRHLRSGALSELTLTTNGTFLAGAAPALAAAGVRRVNVSLDSLDPGTYRQITRGGDLGAVLGGIRAAQRAGLAVKLNAVVLRHGNVDELPRLVAWAHASGLDVSLIEAMPLGAAPGDAARRFVPLDEVRATLERRWTLVPDTHRSAGPSRYVRVLETGGRVGFITPLSHRFCASCNRVRVTCTGTMHPCLGLEDRVELRELLRRSPDDGPLLDAIREGVARKRAHHAFLSPGRCAAPSRPMAVTGG